MDAEGVVFLTARGSRRAVPWAAVSGACSILILDRIAHDIVGYWNLKTVIAAECTVAL